MPRLPYFSCSLGALAFAALGLVGTSSGLAQEQSLESDSAQHIESSLTPMQDYASHRANWGSLLLNPSRSWHPFGASFDYFSKTDQTSHGGNGAMEQANLQLDIPLFESSTERSIVFSASAFYRYSYLNLEGPRMASISDENFHTLALDLGLFSNRNYRQTGGKPFLILSPSFSGDSNSMDSDDLRLSGVAGFSFNPSEKISYTLGIAVSQEFDPLPIMPLIGFKWTPNERYLVEISGARFRAMTELVDRWAVGVFAEWSTAAWNIDYQDNTRTLNSSHAIVGLVLSRQLSEKSVISISAGYTFWNDLTVMEPWESHAERTTSFDEGFVIRVGLKKAF